MALQKKYKTFHPSPARPSTVEAGMRRLAIVGAVLGALVFAESAGACSCVELKPKEAKRQADAVVVARLVEVVPLTEFQSEFRYEVVRTYKGGSAMQPGGPISVLSASMGSACGLPTELERHYGLFLSRAPDGWHGSSCAAMGPRKLAAAMRGRGSERRGSPPGCAS